MNWFSLIPAALGALGGIMGGGQNTSTNTTKLSPELKKLSTDALTAAKDIWGQKYKAYPGQRVAGPTASRAALTPMMSQIGQQVQSGMNDGMGYQARIADMMNAGRGRVNVPSMVPGAPRATYSAPATVAPVPRSF